jgi:sec-independent protein translocase protein TatC
MAARSGRGATREKRMSLGQHLIELRKRLTRAALGILLASIIGYLLSDFVLDAMRDPVTAVAVSQNRVATLNYTDITSAFNLKMLISIYVGLILSSPVWLYQIFAFLVPGLTGKEKRYVFGFFFTAVPLFLAGCAAGWFVLPHIVALLTSFGSQQDAAIMPAVDYFNFVLKLVIAVGIAFVMPVFLVLFNFMGVLSAKTILKSWRIAILLICVFTAIATPAADVMSMFLLAIPMVLLYFMAVGVAFWHDALAQRKARRIDAELSRPSAA